VKIRSLGRKNKEKREGKKKKEKNEEEKEKRRIYKLLARGQPIVTNRYKRR